MAVYSWRYMRRQVKAVLSSCMPCQQARARFKNTTTVLTPHPVVGMFFTWGVDQSGPYPTSERGYNYLFHAVEHHIHVMVSVPIADKRSVTVAFTFLQHVIGQYGACAQVVTDSGSEFKAEFDELMVQLRIDHRIISVNNPQANGLTERAVGTLKRAMSKRVDETGAQDWDIHAVYATLAYNLTPQESTKVAPFHVLYGREPQFPPHAGPPPLLDDSGRNWLSTLEERAAYFRHVMPTLANHLAISKHRDTLRYTYTRSGAYRPQHLQFKPGDYVFVAQHQPHSKLELPARPFILRLLHLTPTGTAEVEGRCGTRHKTHIRNLAPCHLPCIDGRILPELARPDKDHPCEICHLPNKPSKMLLCDRCNKGYHTFCLKPPLTAIPHGNWFCPACVAHVDDVHLAPAGLHQQLAVNQAARRQRRKTLKRRG
jgi:transposase InsO family protein